MVKMKFQALSSVKSFIINVELLAANVKYVEYAHVLFILF